MEWSRVKNILIVLLALVNCFLFGAYLVTSQSFKQAELETRQNLALVLARSGVSIDEEKIPLDSELLYPLCAQRSKAEERQISEKLLGNDMRESVPGGGRYVYSSKKGSATFRAGGLFEITLLDEDVSDEAIYSALGFRRDGFYINGSRVWSLTCEITRGATVKVSGKRMNASAELVRSVKPRDTSGMLLDFIDTHTGIGEISAIELGYDTQVVSGGVNYIPTWKITADGTDFFIYGLTDE